MQKTIILNMADAETQPPLLQKTQSEICLDKIYYLFSTNEPLQTGHVPPIALMPEATVDHSRNVLKIFE